MKIHKYLAIWVTVLSTGKKTIEFLYRVILNPLNAVTLQFLLVW